MPIISDVKYDNHVRTFLVGAINDTVTSIEVVSTAGFPTLVDSSDYFYLVLIDNVNQREIVKVTAVSGTMLTVVRGVDGSTARPFAVNDRVELWVTNGLIEDIYTEISDEVNNIDYANSAAGIDHSDATVPNSIATLVAAAGGAEATIYLSGHEANSGAFEFDDDYTVPKNIQLVFENGAYLTVTAGNTLTINGPVRAGAQRIFDRSAAGTIDVYTGVTSRVQHVLPQWWMDDPNEPDDGSFGDSFEAAAATRAPVLISGNTVPTGLFTLNDFEIQSNKTISALHTRFENGSVIRVDGAALTLNTTIEAGPYRIFRLAGGGSVTGTINADFFYPQWFGADQTGVADSTDAINNLLALMGNSGTILFPKGTYRLHSDLTIPAGVTLLMGDGASFVLGAVFPPTTPTLTINGIVRADAHEVFTGSGTVDGTPLSSRVLPQWFGGSVTNDTTAKEQPEGNISAKAGSLHTDLNLAGTLANIWLKLEGAGNTGWWPLQQLGSETFATGDATPSVENAFTFETDNAGTPTTITNFDDGRPGQTIRLRFADDDTTIDFTSPNLVGNRGFAYQAKTDDVIFAFLIGTVWYCTITQQPPAGWDWDSGWTEVEIDDLYTLSDTGGGPGNFSSTSKADPTTGATNASGTFAASNINPTADDPGFRDFVVMFKPQNNPAYTSWVIMNPMFGDGSSEDHGFMWAWDGSDYQIGMMEDVVYVASPGGTAWSNPLDWDPKVNYTEGLLRIKLRI